MMKNINTFFTAITLIMLYIYSITCVSIPIITNITVITIAIAFILSGNYSEKIKILINFKPLLILLLIVLIHFIGFLYSNPLDFDTYNTGAICRFFGMFWIASYFIIKHPKHAYRLLFLYCMSILIIAVFSFLNFLLFSPDHFISFDFATKTNSMYPMLVTKTEIGVNLAFASIIMLNFAKHTQLRSLKVFSYGCVLLLIFTEFFLNHSRTGYLMESSIVLYYGLSYIKNSKSIFLAIKKILLIISLIIFSFFILFNYSKAFDTTVKQGYNDSISYFTENHKSGSESIRLAWYYTSYKMFFSSPKQFFIGCGTGSFTHCSENIIKKYPTQQQDKMAPLSNQPHNVYIYFAVQSGIIGLLLYISYIVCLIISACKINGWYKNIVLMIIFASFISEQFNPQPFELRNGAIFAFLIGIMLSTYKNTLNSRKLKLDNHNSPTR